MKRRESIKLMVGLLVGGLVSGCAVMHETADPKLTNNMFKADTYTEVFSTIYLSTDDKKLVVMTPRYHYIFDVSYPLLVALKTELHSSITGYLGDMHIDGENRATINVTLTVDDKATALQRGMATAAGFTTQGKRDPRPTYSQALIGVRYLAGNFQPPATALNLNKSYSVKVHAQLREGQKASRILLTPITLTADGVMMLGNAVLFAIMVPVLLPLTHWH
jgi:hypothetical protein